MEGNRAYRDVIIGADELHVVFVSDVLKIGIVQIELKCDISEFEVEYRGKRITSMKTTVSSIGRYYIHDYLINNFNVGDEVSILDFVKDQTNLRHYTTHISYNVNFIIYAKMIITSNRGRTHIGYICKAKNYSVSNAFMYNDYNLKFILKEKDKDCVLIEIKDENISFEKIYNEALEQVSKYNNFWRFFEHCIIIIKQ